MYNVHVYVYVYMAATVNKCLFMRVSVCIISVEGSCAYIQQCSLDIIVHLV